MEYTIITIKVTFVIYMILTRKKTTILFEWRWGFDDAEYATTAVCKVYSHLVGKIRKKSTNPPPLFFVVVVVVYLRFKDVYFVINE